MPFFSAVAGTAVSVFSGTAVASGGVGVGALVGSAVGSAVASGVAVGAAVALPDAAAGCSGFGEQAVISVAHRISAKSAAANRFIFISLSFPCTFGFSEI